MGEKKSAVTWKEFPRPMYEQNPRAGESVEMAAVAMPEDQAEQKNSVRTEERGFHAYHPEREEIQCAEIASDDKKDNRKNDEKNSKKNNEIVIVAADG